MTAVILFMSSFFVLGAVSTYVDLDAAAIARVSECHRQSDVIPEFEVCKFYGFSEKCRMKQRYVYTYRSHKILKCLNNNN